MRRAVLAMTLVLWGSPAAGQTLLISTTHQAEVGDGERLGFVPTMLTTRVLDRPVQVVRGSSDTSWLQDLTVPDFDMTLAAPVVEQLERIREPGWWHDTIGRWMKRSGRYKSMIRRILREEGMPEDLLYVSMIESSFNPKARSHAGAAGLWQFMPAAGTENGLRQDRWVDQRYDPERSTRAAAKALKRLHQRLGTWELAFAAYNMGYYGLVSSIRRYNTNDYWRLRSYEYALPYETRNYVPRILAAAVVGRNSGRFGYIDLEGDPPIESEVVEVHRPMTLKRLAGIVGTTRRDLEKLNPELRRGRTPGGVKVYGLRVPVGSAATASSKLSRFRKAPPVKLERHKVKLGEDLGSIAEQYGISKGKLARMNQMETRSKVEPGSTLKVPSRGESVSKASGDDAAIDPVTVVVPSQQFLYRDRRRVFYRTVSGDTLERIASSFGVTSSELALWNDLDATAALQADMVIQLFVPLLFDRWSQVKVLREEQVRLFVAGTIEHYEHVAKGQNRRRIVYRAKRGDTLKRLSRRFGLSEGVIARINHFSRRHDPEVGEEIILYVAARKAPRKRIVKGGSPR